MEITRRDMVTNEAITKDVPLVDDQKVLVKIPLSAYLQLISWASVGRSLDAAIQAADDDAGQELIDLKPSLDACHQACRWHWLSLPRAANKTGS